MELTRFMRRGIQETKEKEKKEIEMKEKEKGVMTGASVLRSSSRHSCLRKDNDVM